MLAAACYPCIQGDAEGTWFLFFFNSSIPFQHTKGMSQAMRS